MIRNKEDLKYYMIEDKKALGIKDSSFLDKLSLLLFPNRVWEFEKILRKTEYVLNVHHSYKLKRMYNKFLRYYYLRKLDRISERLGFYIRPNCIGPGLRIQHYGGIIINPNCRIGKNFTIRPFTVIGNKKTGSNEVPMIGDNVKIGCNVSIVGNVRIGNNVTIGAGSVVTRDCLDGIYVGNPARRID